MTKALVGYTGFVGSNLASSTDFDNLYNSRNIEEAYGTRPDLLVYAGLRAEKYLANRFPEKDLALIEEAEENIRRIAPKKLVLISTIDVFKHPVEVDEKTPVDTEDLHPYGLHRYYLEERVRKQYPDALIIRLPGLFGKNLKKNFLYDYLHVIPMMLKEEKYLELLAKEPSLSDYYERQDNGFYRSTVREEDREHVKAIFRGLGFSALNFTDSRSVFQFYDLSRLWGDIETLLSNEIRLFHPAVEPLSVEEIYHSLTGESFENILPAPPAYYDYRTIHSGLFGREDGYIASREEVLKEIKTFAEGYR